MTGSGNRFSIIWQDWRWRVRRDGWRAAWPHIRQEALTLPYRRIKFAVVARSLAHPLPETRPKAAITVRPFAADDLDFVRREYLPSEAHLCAQRLARGHDGIAACIEGQIVGYAWSCTDASLERVDLCFEPGDVLFTDAFTAPGARGQGVQTVLSKARLRAAQEKGYRRILAYIEVNNAPSLAVWQKKMNADVVAHITFTRIGLWRKTVYVE
ncbi:MAG: N-acetyltransferase family protein [Anaerolineales bacterium]